MHGNLYRLGSYYSGLTTRMHWKMEGWGMQGNLYRVGSYYSGLTTRIWIPPQGKRLIASVGATEVLAVARLRNASATSRGSIVARAIMESA